MVKAVYCWDFSTILTCQNPLLKSIMEKCAAPAVLSNASWICSKGYESFSVCTLSLQKSMQKHSDSSFFLTNTTALHHRDWLGHITPVSSISRSKVCTSSKSVGGMCLNRSLNGSLSVMWISCSIVLVQPSSFPSNVKMRSRAVAAFGGVQLLRPSKFSFSNSFSCHVVTDIGSCKASIPRVASISVDSSAGGTGEAETTRATCTRFFTKIGDSDMFLTTMDTLLLLILSLVYMCKTCSLGGRGCAPPGWDSPAPKGITIT